LTPPAFTQPQHYPAAELEERCKAQLAFWDRMGFPQDPLTPQTIARYVTREGAREAWSDYPYTVLGDVRGKRILELGCGSGSNAILLALRGATVVGVDLHPGAVTAARRRAAAHGVDERTSFVCQAAEEYVATAQNQFDIVVTWGYFCHTLPSLEFVTLGLKRLTHPGSEFCFSEPISLWMWLRHLRLMLPWPPAGGPGERPLETTDLAIFERYLGPPQVRYFNWATRIYPLIRRSNAAVEQGSASEQWMVGACEKFDRALFSTPLFAGLASLAVYHYRRQD
jgi:2-polyprenyl-3-methyl-5-hydroxy-6-metoxy-1,4-benzoquinol methylase